MSQNPLRQDHLADTRIISTRLRLLNEAERETEFKIKQLYGESFYGETSRNPWSPVMDSLQLPCELYHKHRRSVVPTTCSADDDGVSSNRS